MNSRSLPPANRSSRRSDMANPWKGEVEAVIDGQTRTLRLTLGALADIEAGTGAGDLVALAERFEQGRISARDAIRVIGAGLRGAGGAETDAEVAQLAIEGGAPGALRLVARLFAAAFGDEASAL